MELMALARDRLGRLAKELVESPEERRLVLVAAASSAATLLVTFVVMWLMRWMRARRRSSAATPGGKSKASGGKTQEVSAGALRGSPPPPMPPGSPVIPASVFSDHKPRMSRPESAADLAVDTSLGTSGSSERSFTGPTSPGRSSGLMRTLGAFSGRKRGDSHQPGAVTNAEPGSPRGPRTSQLRKMTLPDNVDDIDPDLRAAVAPWLVQDDSLAKVSSVVVDGSVSMLSRGGKAVFDDDDDADAGTLPDGGSDRLALRVKVAPWLAQADAPDDGSGDEEEKLDVNSNDAATRVRSGSLIKAALSPIISGTRRAIRKHPSAGSPAAAASATAPTTT